MRYLLALMLSAVLCLPLLAQAAGQKTLQNAASVSADGSNLATENAGAVGVSVTITSAATVTFKGSADGGLTWSPITCTNIDTLASAQFATATGQYQCPVAGLSHFETPAAITSGTVTSIATASPGSLGSSTTSASVSSLGTATAAAPSLSEASSTSFSFDLAGNARVTLGTLLSGEDQTNNLLMTSGGAVRFTQILGTGLVPSTASDATSAVSLLPVGKKTLVGVVTCTGTCVQTQKIYGTWQSSTAYGEELCTLNLNASTTAHASCIIDTAWAYYFVVTTNTSGTTPLSGVFAMY